MFEIILSVICTMNLFISWVLYDKISSFQERFTFEEEEINEEKEVKSQYNESVDPISPDPEMHDYFVRLAKEERE